MPFPMYMSTIYQNVSGIELCYPRKIMQLPYVSDLPLEFHPQGSSPIPTLHADVHSKSIHLSPWTTRTHQHPYWKMFEIRGYSANNTSHFTQSRPPTWERQQRYYWIPKRAPQLQACHHPPHQRRLRTKSRFHRAHQKWSARDILRLSGAKVLFSFPIFDRGISWMKMEHDWLRTRANWVIISPNGDYNQTHLEASGSATSYACRAPPLPFNNELCSLLIFSILLISYF